MVNAREVFQREYDNLLNEYLDDGMDEDEAEALAADGAREYVENYMAEYGDYLYEQHKDRLLRGD